MFVRIQVKPINNINFVRVRFTLYTHHLVLRHNPPAADLGRRSSNVMFGDVLARTRWLRWKLCQAGRKQRRMAVSAANAAILVQPCYQQRQMGLRSRTHLLVQCGAFSKSNLVVDPDSIGSEGYGLPVQERERGRPLSTGCPESSEKAAMGLFSLFEFGRLRDLL